MAAFLNALHEEGTKQDCWDAAARLWEENKVLRAAITAKNEAFIAVLSDKIKLEIALNGRL